MSDSIYFTIVMIIVFIKIELLCFMLFKNDITDFRDLNSLE